MPHVALVGKRTTRLNHLANVVLLQHRVVGIEFLDTLLAQSDVEHLQSAYIRLVLLKEEGELHVLQCQRQVGMDDIGTYIIGIVLRHQS